MNERKKHYEKLSVGEVSKRTGVNVSTLHFYESKGLIMSSRNSANQRRYERAVLRIVSVIKVAQGLGFSLKEIKSSLSLGEDHDLTSEDWKRLGKTWKVLLDQRIEKMTRLRDQLTDCIGCGCLMMKTCPLRNPNDELSKKGAGPQLI